MSTPRALLSVHDKTNLIPFAQALNDLGWALIASGGTARQLRAAFVPVLDVAGVTGAPELLDGRVKTLHPAIHAGILARDNDDDRAELAAQTIEPIDLVVCNLYPFAETIARPEASLEEAIEQIDIGGVTLLRAAAKNFARVTVVCDPGDYQAVLDQLLRQGAVTEMLRRQLAAKAFALTRDYDAAVAAYLENNSHAPPGDNDRRAAAVIADRAVHSNDHAHAAAVLPERLSLELVKLQPLRYGENPHQQAALYTTGEASGPLGGQLLGGKPLSYNNILDLDAAWRAVCSFHDPTIVIVKHLTPCGIASAATLADAFPAALASDPVSAFGGVIAANRLVDEAFTQVVDEARLFVEAVAAPAFSEESVDWFARKKKNCRLLEVKSSSRASWELRSVKDGFLVQEWDRGDPSDGVEPASGWQVVSQRQPTDEEWAAMRFGWLAVQHVKSNAIVFAHAAATVGIGGGLPSRVDAARLAAAKAGERAQGAAMASDALIPFSDAIEAAAEAGITAVVQPGGSIRDEEVIAAADRLGMALVFTGVRHFRH